MYFLFVFGFIAPRYILMELFCETNGSCCPTLRKLLAHCTLPLRTAIKIATDICIAIHELHFKGLLYNDQHSGNILIRNSSDVKIINFGKSTLVTDPLKYEIEPQSKHYERFNAVHLFLACELCNIRGSYQSIVLDVYSVGYNIDSIAKSLKSQQMTLLAVDMISKSPEERPHLRHCISALEKMNLDSSCALCVCVSVCLYPFTVKASSVCKMSDTCLRGTDQRYCVVSIIRCASAKFLHLGICKYHISPPKMKTPGSHELERKRM